jgi:hypothetical protein
LRTATENLLHPISRSPLKITRYSNPGQEIFLCVKT